MSKKNYVSVIYNLSSRPITGYPYHLIDYLRHRYNILPASKLLDYGCGRGDFLCEFIDAGIDAYGVDQSSIACQICDPSRIYIGDLERESLPFADNSFDYVFSKSVCEHFYDPGIMFAEIYRVLKPGGLVITMCPSWEYCYRIYFEDYTHRSPFMRSSLRDIHLMNGFENVSCNFFLQLPSTWNGRFKTLFKLLAWLTRRLVPNFFNSRFKWVRFSKEVMLLASATKPN